MHFIIILNFFTESQLFDTAIQFKKKLMDFIHNDSVLNILLKQAKKHKSMTKAMQELY